MSIPKPEGRLSGHVLTGDALMSSPSSRRDQQDEETSDCPLLTPSPPPKLPQGSLDATAVSLDQTISNINSEDGLAFLNLVNSTCKRMHDEPSSRDPMVETSSNSGSSSDTNEPVCTQLLTQLNTAYTHLAPDAQALFYNQDSSGKPPLTGIQLVVPKPPKDFSFTKWDWPVIRKVCFWSFMSLFAGCVALVVGVIATMPKRCDPTVEWWQGSLFYEIFPASFRDSYKNDGIGDLRGVTDRLDYLEGLGVKAVRLNSIFPAQGYPKRYANVESLTEIEPLLGTLDDFDDMLASIHSRGMALVLDLPLHPFVESLEGANATSSRPKRAESDDQPPLASSAFAAWQEASAPTTSDPSPSRVNGEPSPNPLDGNAATRAIRFWHDRGVDGFYLKGLERYAHELGFAAALRHWRSIIGRDRVFMCSERAFEASSGPARNTLLATIDLVDVKLDADNGTRGIKRQVLGVLKGPLFQRPGYPWVHWSTGSVDTPRLASGLRLHNASVAVAMMGIMLPGTPSIFYGDELGLLNSESSETPRQLVPMRWDDKKSSPSSSASTDLVSEMLRLRSEATPIYVKAVVKSNEAVANGDVRYTADEVIVIERWYPRRNTYVFVANLGPTSQTKDLSSLYYGGYVVVGPEQKLNRNIYFKELTVPPGEALVIKLDK